MNYKILSTKKLLPEVVEQARQNNIQLYEVEFISVRNILTKEKQEEISQLFRKRSPVVFTSASAVQAIEKHLQSGLKSSIPAFKIYSLSAKTREVIEHSDILQYKICAVGRNASELAEQIIRHGEKEVVFFCGNQRRDELPEMLAEHNISVHECVVYETMETPSLITDCYDGILFFSPSAVKSFFSVNQLHGDVVCFAIGETTGASIKEITSNKVIISQETSQENMMNTVIQFFIKK